MNNSLPSRYFNRNLSSSQQRNNHPRLVDLERQRLKTRKLEEKELQMHSGKDPDFVVRNPSESQGGVLETYITVGMNISNIIFTNIFPRLVKTVGKNFVMGSALYLTMKTIR